MTLALTRFKVPNTFAMTLALTRSTVPNTFGSKASSSIVHNIICYCPCAANPEENIIFYSRCATNPKEDTIFYFPCAANPEDGTILYFPCAANPVPLLSTTESLIALLIQECYKDIFPSPCLVPSQSCNSLVIMTVISSLKCSRQPIHSRDCEYALGDCVCR